ncbi:MAG: RNA polymerase sigma factor [Nocardioidaceae bacterium]
MTTGVPTEDLWRELAPQVLGAVVRRYGDFGIAEDAVQEALLAAATQWPTQGMPDNPKSWLITVASRRFVDRRRSDQARERRESDAALRAPADELVAPGADSAGGDRDDTLTLLLLCCHPALTPPSQIALTLRAVGGLSTAQIARAFLLPESTLAQRISRAKATIRRAGAHFELPPPSERPERMGAVLHVLYLIFNEGYTATEGPDLHRVELTREAIRLTRQARDLLPRDGEVAGLLALMLLTEARRPARTRPDGALLPLAEQDRSRWEQRLVAEGVDLITDTLSWAPLGPYQLQAAIAAVHDEADSAGETDWPQILGLYQLLERFAPGPMVVLGHAVAAAMVNGPGDGLAMLRPLDDDPRFRRHHRLHAVRGHLLEMAGDRRSAHDEYELAARLATSIPEQNYLRGKADDCARERD